MPHDEPTSETYNPWTIVNVVFHHLVEHGFHPTLGAGGHPGEPAADLLRALGVSPTVEGDQRIVDDVRERLAQLRTSMLEKPESG
jgi:hypothetical protein